MSTSHRTKFDFQNRTLDQNFDTRDERGEVCIRSSKRNEKVLFAMARIEAGFNFEGSIHCLTWRSFHVRCRTAAWDLRDC